MKKKYESEAPHDPIEKIAKSLTEQAENLERQAKILRSTASLMRHPHFRNMVLRYLQPADAENEKSKT